jgi:hypothetical protein
MWSGEMKLIGSVEKIPRLMVHGREDLITYFLIGYRRHNRMGDGGKFSGILFLRVLNLISLELTSLGGVDEATLV